LIWAKDDPESLQQSQLISCFKICRLSVMGRSRDGVGMTTEAGSDSCRFAAKGLAGSLSSHFCPGALSLAASGEPLR
jgi:hypothetical protein